MLPPSVCVPYIQHSHQEKITLLRVKLLHTLSDYDGFNNPLILPAIRNREADGRWYNGVALIKYYTAYSVRLASANLRSAADRGVLWAHHVKHFYVAGFLLHCSDIISPLSLPVTQLAEGIAVRMGIQVTANTTRMEQNKGEEETGGEKIEN